MKITKQRHDIYFKGLHTIDGSNIDRLSVNAEDTFFENEGITVILKKDANNRVTHKKMIPYSSIVYVDTFIERG